MSKRPMILVVGRAGAGKSEVARAMSKVLGWEESPESYLGFPAYGPAGVVYHADLSRERIDDLKRGYDVWAVLHVVRDVATTQLGRLPDGEQWLPNNRSCEFLRSLAGYRAAQIIENRRAANKETK